MLEFDLDFCLNRIYPSAGHCFHCTSGDQRYEMHYGLLEFFTFHDYSSRKVGASSILAEAFLGTVASYIVHIPGNDVRCYCSNVSIGVNLRARRTLTSRPMQMESSFQRFKISR